MNKKAALFLAFFCGIMALSAQTTLPITKVSNSKFQLGDRIDKLHNLGDLFQDDPTSKLFFGKFNKARKAQRTANIIAPSIFVLSTIAISTSTCDGLGCLGAAILWGGANVIGASYVVFANLASGNNKAKAKKGLLVQINKLALIEDLTIEPINNIVASPRELLSYSHSSQLWTKGSDSGKFHELGEAIVFDEYSLALFSDYEDYRKKEKRRFRTAGILGGAVLIMAVLNPTVIDEDTAKAKGHIRLTQIYPGISAVFMGGLALVSGNSKKKTQRTLVNYNNGLDSPPDLGMNAAPSLDLIMGTNGLGIAYTF